LAALQAAPSLIEVGGFVADAGDAALMAGDVS
jgi:hypothetical protein